MCGFYGGDSVDFDLLFGVVPNLCGLVREVYSSGVVLDVLYYKPFRNDLGPIQKTSDLQLSQYEIT